MENREWGMGNREFLWGLVGSIICATLPLDPTPIPEKKTAINIT